MYGDNYNLDPYHEAKKTGSPLTTFLSVILVLLIVVLVGGTAVALVTNKDGIGSQYRRADPRPERLISASRKSDKRLNAYTELGQIRTITKSPDDSHTGALLIVEPWFSLAAGDTPLLEELKQKRRKEQNIIENYFGMYTESELKAKGLTQIKEELCALINEQLVLGKIENVYFTEYMFFS